MKSKEYIDLQGSVGHLIDIIDEIDGIIDGLDKTETEEYIEVKRKIDGLYADAEEIKRVL